MQSELIVPAILFIVGLAVLIKASDIFTESAEKIGLALGLPPFIIGVTIIAVGTSLPELISSLIAVSQSASEIVVANVLGSNITNIFLIVGIAGVLSAKSGIHITYDLIGVDLPLFVGSAFLFGLVIQDGNVSTGECLLFIISYIVYLFYILKTSDENEDQEADTQLDVPRDKRSGFIARQGLLVILSGIFIYLGARYTIDSLIKISDILNIGREIIAVSAVALGTSLPELAVTINASLKNKAEVAIGNVLGSNIFNIFIVMGVPGLFGRLVIPPGVLISGLPALMAGTLLLFFAVQDHKLTIWEGWLFICLYIWFTGATFGII